MVQIAFYKSKYKWWSALIRWWTNSKYSHCEFYINGKLWGISSEQKVRSLEQPLNLDKWDLLTINSLTEEDVKQFYEKTKGAKYDWQGVFLSNVIAKRKQNSEKYTCSEWVIKCIDQKLDIIYPKKYISISPQDVYDIIIEKGL